jgi:hypothetical protein
MKGTPMRNLLTAIVAMTILTTPAFGMGWLGWLLNDDPPQQHHQSGGDHQGNGYHAAPGPLAGAGLPFLAVGFGVYWLVRRARRKPN